MNKALLFLLLSACLLPAVSAPVRDAAAAKSLSFIEDSAPVNLWVWPTSARSVSDSPDYTPSSIWNPEPNVWYLCATVTGYFFVAPDDRGIWGPDWMSSRNASGYSVGVFLVLLPGHYVISCEVDQPPQFYLSYYKAVEGGYKYTSYVSLASQSTAGVYKRVFIVPDDAGMVFVSMRTRDSGSSVPAMTVTDIEIYRLD